MRPLLVLIALTWATPAVAQVTEQIVEIRIHGNHTTPDADVLAVSGLAVGEPAAEARLQEAEQKLRASRRFAGVEVRRRYLSIADPTQILVVVVVDEVEGVTSDDLTPGWVRRFRSRGMWLPILNYSDGYGLTYGVRVTLVNPLGPRTQISVPLSWGGERRAGFEVERTFERGAVSAIRGSLAMYRRVNPHFDVPDTRLEARVRTERALGPWLRVGVGARTASVDFNGFEERHDAAGADLVFDTRLDPSFPRNAVHTVVGWERLGFGPDSAGRWLGDARGFIGVGGSNVLALRTQFALANAALPPSEQSLLGGGGTLRGYPAGHRAGDKMAALSAEVRVPAEFASELRPVWRHRFRRYRRDVVVGGEAARPAVRSRDRRRRVLRDRRADDHPRRRLARVWQPPSAFRIGGEVLKGCEGAKVRRCEGARVRRCEGAL